LIEGAEPGNLIVATIEKLELSRATGTSASVMTASAVDALGTKGAPVTWTIDKSKGVVRFDLLNRTRKNRTCASQHVIAVSANVVGVKSPL
jgi:hypothetical protein